MMKECQSQPGRLAQPIVRIVPLLILLFAFAFVVPPKPAHACTPCVSGASDIAGNEWPKTYRFLTERLTTELTAHRVWIVSVLWEDNILPAMMLMADQLTAVAFQQTQIFGTFFDAKHQLETQQSLQKIAARAHKDYHPSTGMCEFGSGVKSLAASERRSEFNAIVLSQRSQDRTLGNANTSAATGPSLDQDSRIRQFRNTFCNVRDNNNGLTLMCDHDQDSPTYAGLKGAVDKSRVNKDIDFVRTIGMPLTLNVDLTSTENANDPNLASGLPTQHEEEVFALASNLYGHDVFPRPTTGLRPSDIESITLMQGFYLDARSVMAKRSVAENSFNALVALKSEGVPESKDYLKAVLKELGVGGQDGGVQTDIDLMLGNNPSYHAQMEVLTKKIYQNPDFYTNLYDKPANVSRKQVALQAIGLMQKFDLFKSYLRNEASLSVLLELAVSDIQEDVESEMGNLTGFGETAKE